jgi:mono/diheme cytochrome c family protein
MKHFLYAILCSCLLAFGACEWENEEELFAEAVACAEPVVFTTHIAPIIQTNCAISGCHAAGGISPELTSYEKVKARAADVRHETGSGEMPPSYSNKNLSQEQIDKIACWVEQGMPRE